MSRNQTFNSYKHRMNYTEIEMEWMKEILRDKEEEIKKLKSDLSLVIKERDNNIKQNKKLKDSNTILMKNWQVVFTLENRIDELLEQNKKLSEENGQLKKDLAFKNTMLDNVKAEYESLQDVNKKLKEDNRFLTKISKEYMKKENIIEVAEFTELYKNDLEEENQKLNERIRFLEQCLDNKEKVNKSLREENKRLSDFLECES